MAFSHSNKDEQLPSRYEEYPPPWAYPPMYAPAEEQGASILDYVRAVWRHKWLILFLAFMGAALGYGITRVSPKKYRTDVSLMTLSSGGGLGGLASQIGSMPMVGGALGDLGKVGGGKSKELVNILKSRTLAEKIIRHFDLMKVLYADQYDPKTDTYTPRFMKPVPILQDAIGKFQGTVIKVEEEKKTTLIRISVTLKDPALAAKIANRMVAELQDFIENNSLTISKRNRVFLEEQLVNTRVKLLESGKELNQFYADNKISSVVPQIDVNVGSFQTSTKPFAEFQDEFEKLNQQEADAAAKKQQARVDRVPGQVYLQFLTLSRELQVKTYGLLTQQYELAKIEEAKEDLAFQVIDKAQVRERASSPNLIVNVAGGLLFGFFLGVLIALLRDFIQKEKAKEMRAA